MVWVATWHLRRFCVGAELTVRFRRSAAVGQVLTIEARVEAPRRASLNASPRSAPRTRAGSLRAAGKCVPMPEEQNRQMMAALIEQPSSLETLAALRAARPQRGES